MHPQPFFAHAAARPIYAEECKACSLELSPSPRLYVCVRIHVLVLCLCGKELCTLVDDLSGRAFDAIQPEEPMGQVTTQTQRAAQHIQKQNKTQAYTTNTTSTYSDSWGLRGGCTGLWPSRLPSPPKACPSLSPQSPPPLFPCAYLCTPALSSRTSKSTVSSSSGSKPPPAMKVVGK